MKPMIFFLVLLVCMFQFGCQPNVYSPKYQFKTNKTYPPVKPDEVVILRSTKPTWKYEEIGRVNQSSYSDLVLLFKYLREKAGAVGANAIVNFDIRTESYTTTDFRMVRTANGGSLMMPTSRTSLIYYTTGILVRKIEEQK